MTPEQQTAIEKAASKYCVKGDEYVDFVHGMKEVITNPSDFGLVSKEDMFSFAEWVKYEYKFMLNHNIWVSQITNENATTSQLFEIYKTKP